MKKYRFFAILLSAAVPALLLIAGAAYGQSTTSPPAPSGFVRIEGGTFMMGSNNGEVDEKPPYQVTVPSFYMGKYPVTQKEWRDVMGTSIQQQQATAKGSALYGTGDSYPMYYVNWEEAVEYCNRLSMRDKLTPVYSGSGDDIQCNWNANGYRLPTEAEWEYAARGGNKASLTYTYSGSNSPDSVGWYSDNSGGGTHPVGQKQGNDLGLYDMSGNVWEWCWDWYGGYSSGSQTNPVGPSSGSYRVLRSGSWDDSAAFMRSAHRYYFTPSSRYCHLGFRVVRPSL